MSRENLDHVVQGVLFSFMGWLTCRDEKLVLSKEHDAAPAAEAVKEFCKLRGVQDCEPLNQWEGRLAKAIKPEERVRYERCGTGEFE